MKLVISAGLESIMEPLASRPEEGGEEYNGQVYNRRKFCSSISPGLDASDSGAVCDVDAAIPPAART